MVERYTTKLNTGVRQYEHLIETFDSLNEFLAEAERLHNPKTTKIWDRTRAGARDGVMHDEVPSILDIASQAVIASNELKDVITFAPAFDVAGDYVDMGRYMTGEPECMVYSPLQPVRTVNPVITLVSSADCNFGGEWKTRGIIATALALALARLGYATEMWADNYGYGGSVYQYQRIKVKSTLDELNPARLLFGFGDEAMLSELAFGCYDGYSRLGYNGGFRTFQNANSRGRACTRSEAVKALYPDGTIFITGALYGGANPAAVAAVVVQELKQAKLIA